MVEQKMCPVCEKPVKGRTDKRFCGTACKSAYHYQILRKVGDGLYVKVDKQLKTNRRILKRFNKAGKATVRSEVLIKQGFDPQYFTNYWKNSHNEVYLFVYEYGFLSKMENGKKKYILVTWQPYMGK